MGGGRRLERRGNGGKRGGREVRRGEGGGRAPPRASDCARAPGPPPRDGQSPPVARGGAGRAGRMRSAARARRSPGRPLDPFSDSEVPPRPLAIGCGLRRDPSPRRDWSARLLRGSTEHALAGLIQMNACRREATFSMPTGARGAHPEDTQRQSPGRGIADLGLKVRRAAVPIRVASHAFVSLCQDQPHRTDPRVCPRSRLARAASSPRDLGLPGTIAGVSAFLAPPPPLSPPAPP